MYHKGAGYGTSHTVNTHNMLLLLSAQKKISPRKQTQDAQAKICGGHSNEIRATSPVT